MEPHYNQMVICPFNRAHQVEHYRIQVHLTKCQRQYPNQRITKCPFDATHFVKEEELNHHVTNCRQRVMLDTQIYITDDDHKPVTTFPPQPAVFDTGTSTENWDNDNVETYKPLEAKKGAPMYNKIKGATKSERNKFRYENTLQFMQAQQKHNEAGKTN